MFIDHIIIHAKAGDGGRGCVAFRREAYVPKGGPSGGDGGKGGDVILEASPHVADFRDYFYKPHLRAQNGGHGLGSNCTGKSAPDLVAKVPVGTVVYRLPPNKNCLARNTQNAGIPQREDANLWRFAGRSGLTMSSLKKIHPRDVSLEVIADLARPGESVVLCRGGRGGLGNRHFASPNNPTPRYAQPGQEGESGSFFLELKTIADVGLVGFPNAGKSSLLAALTHARPLIAAYPFTTLHPNVGVLELEDYSRITFADIPGLLPGASRGVGLGYDFLRHVERTSVLLFVIDMAGTDNRDPCEDLPVLEGELAAYSANLLNRPHLIVANKMDLPTAGVNYHKFLKKFPNKTVIPISAQQAQGLPQLVQAVRNVLKEANQQPASKPNLTLPKE